MWQYSVAECSDLSLSRQDRGSNIRLRIKHTRRINLCTNLHPLLISLSLLRLTLVRVHISRRLLGRLRYRRLFNTMSSLL